MDLNSINTFLSGLGEQLGDSRLHYCRLALESTAGDTIHLAGAVLDVETKTAVSAACADQFPTIPLDTSGIQVLRQSPPALRAVITNLAGLHSQPSRTSEMVSQILNGQIVEYLLEEDDWVFARQMDGYLGWVFKLYLSAELPTAQPTHLISVPVAYLRSNPGSEEPLVSRLFAGTAVKLIDQTAVWARLQLAGERSGWVPLAALRSLGQLPQTAKKRRIQLVNDSRPYTGVPYRWGGCTVHGIDCSGLVQLLYKLSGVTLPRDADMQFAAGEAVEPPFQPGDLLYFGAPGGQRKITHVGLSLGDWSIIHSSGPRNGVYADDVRAVSWLRDRFIGANTFINQRPA